jgi:hypothetical protein
MIERDPEGAQLRPKITEDFCSPGAEERFLFA